MAPTALPEPRDDVWLDLLTNGELAARLEQRGLRPVVVEALIADRETAGGRWRIEAELGLP